jgi:hypothetical protein
VTIQEAIKSDKLFQRPCWSGAGWLRCSNEGEEKIVWEDGDQFEARAPDLLASDWVLKEPPRERLIAWVGEGGQIQMREEYDGVSGSWRRARWLDEPEEK